MLSRLKIITNVKKYLQTIIVYNIKICIHQNERFQIYLLTYEGQKLIATFLDLNHYKIKNKYSTLYNSLNI